MASKKSLIVVLFLFLSLQANDDSPDAGQASQEKYDKVSTTPSLKKTFNNIVGQLGKAANGGLNMVEGMGQSFGWVTKDYTYSYRVFNDAPASVFVVTEQLTELLGAAFRGEIKQAAVVGPNANTGDSFYNQQLFLTVWVCGDAKQSDLNKYSQTPHEYLQKYGGIAGKIHVTGKDKVGKAIAEVLKDILATLGRDLGAIASGIVDIVQGLTEQGLKVVQNITGLDVGADKLADPLEKYSLVSRKMYPPGQKGDDKIYYYHTYSSYDEKNNALKMQGEYLDLAGTTSEFNGQFYNHSTKKIPMQFTKDGKNYTVTLEPDSFSLLQSSSGVAYSIRPKQDDATVGFQFYNESVSDQNKIAFIPISADGIGNIVSTQQDPKKMVKKDDLVVVGPKLYTYEVVDTPNGPAVGIQGLKIGNYDQPTSGKIRDINPAICHLWYKDAKTSQAEMEKEQAEKKEAPDYSAVPFDVPEQVWINYQTTDYVLQEKVPTGSVVNFYLIRPQLQEQEAWLYVVTLQTDNDTKAKKFLDRLSAGTIGAQAIFTDVTQEELDKKTILTIKPNVNGFIVDNQGADASGITGAVVLADWFAPEGVGSGPFYYELDPSLLRVDQFANSIWFDNKFYTKDAKTGSMSLSTNVLKELSELLPQWIMQYHTNPDAAKAALKKYLQEKGNGGDPAKGRNGIFVDATKPPAQREFTEQGKNLFQTLVDGPISLQHYPIMRKAGTNWYTRTLGDKPEGWPQ